MAIRTIVTVPDPILKQVSKPVETVDDALRALMDDMLETMYDAPGIGLAAIQVGVPKRVLVMDIATEEEGRMPRHFVNPEIVWESEELASYQEGCLSVPESFGDVDRPAEVKVRYLDYNGEPREIHATGLLATCIQHEMDHLNGVLFIDHLSRMKRDIIVRKLTKARKIEAAE
ncbi:peptide deformylase [Emcibacter sp. SYSU 3D8]|uniref:peptide deformylase n=1 Tax=Emcibacter sp. SYSU 3D8 TaxID=3133969 RepID=UPI0031FF0F67